MCPRESMTRPQGFMDIDLYRSIIQQAVECGVTKVALENYGEPMFDRQLFDRAKFAQSLGLETSTITNGSLMFKLQCRQVLSYFDIIRISLNGMTAETYGKIHRGLDFYTVIENIDTLLSLKKHYDAKTKILLSFVMTHENKGDVIGFIKKYESLVDRLSVWKPHNWIYGRQYRKASEAKRTCGRPETGPIQVQWDGKVVPCCFDYDSRMVLGDLNHQSLEDIVNGPAYKRLRKAHRDGDFSGYPCDSCDQLHKDDSVLIYSNSDQVAVGTTNSGLFKL